MSESTFKLDCYIVDHYKRAIKSAKRFGWEEILEHALKNLSNHKKKMIERYGVEAERWLDENG